MSDAIQMHLFDWDFITFLSVNKNVKIHKLKYLN